MARACARRLARACVAAPQLDAQTDCAPSRVALRAVRRISAKIFIGNLSYATTDGAQRAARAGLRLCAKNDVTPAPT